MPSANWLPNLMVSTREGDAGIHSVAITALSGPERISRCHGRAPSPSRKTSTPSTEQSSGGCHAKCLSHVGVQRFSGGTSWSAATSLTAGLTAAHRAASSG